MADMDSFQAKLIMQEICDDLARKVQQRDPSSPSLPSSLLLPPPSFSSLLLPTHILLPCSPCLPCSP